MNRILFFAMIAIAITVGTTIAMLPAQNEKKPKIHEQHDKSTYPVAEYDAAEPSDLSLKTLRKARNKRHNLPLRPTDKIDVRRFMLTERSESSWGGPPSHAPVEPGLPAAKSDVVLIGEVTDAKAYLSEDKTNVYSEFTVRVEEILKNNTSIALAPGTSITTVRSGGALRFPSGKIIQRGSGGKPFPQTKGRYVFFLAYENEEQDHPILTAYEIRGGVVLPLDGLDLDGRLLEPYAEYQQYKGWNEAEFLNKVREAIALTANGGEGGDQ